MEVSMKGIAALVAHEGIVAAPYLDSVGVWTYGVGHTKAAGYPDPAALPRGMPKDLNAALREVFKVFADDLEEYSEPVRRAFTRPLAQHQFDAAVSFHFNTGRISSATWVKTFNAGDTPRAVDQIMNWRSPSEIIPRRRAEQALFERGEYPDSNATVWSVTSAGRVVWSPAKTLSQDDIIALLGHEMLPASANSTDAPAEVSGNRSAEELLASIRLLISEYDSL